MNRRVSAWPGPRPYDEAEWRIFSGRGPELKSIRDKLLSDRLVILAGRTASGKTSLIRAGLTPLLRLERYYENSDQKQLPVLQFRQWCGADGGSLHNMLRWQLEQAIKEIHDWGSRERQELAVEDAKVLRAALGSSTLEARDSGTSVEILEMMASVLAARTRSSSLGRAGDGLVLIFDQMEGLLRGGALQVNQLIRDLYRSTASFRVLISLRQEYLYTLRGLEAMVGPLSRRTIFLRPLDEVAVLRVIDEASRRSNIAIDAYVASGILELLRVDSLGLSGFDQPDVDGEVPFSVEGTAIRVPDLLRLQAVLWELSDFAIRKRYDRVSREVLEEYLGQSGCQEEEVVGGALERWIEAALRGRMMETEGIGDSDGREGSRNTLGEWVAVGMHGLQDQLRGVAIRIGPYLSSLDYKVPYEENELFKVALGEDIARLGLKDRRLREKIRIVDHRPPRLNVEELGLLNRLSGEEWRVSGTAKRHGWTPATTANQLAICFRETLQQLAVANIITSTVRRQGEREIRVWELVHDRFGPAFASWAREHLHTWQDSIDSLVVSQGIVIAVVVPEIRPPEGSDRLNVEGLSWQGCTIVRPVETGRLRFHDVWFVGCNFSGSIFDSCDFVGGGFENCIMDGMLFRDCSFQVGEEGSTPLWRASRGDGIVLRDSSIEKLEVRECSLRQPTFHGMSVDGGVKFTGGSSVVQGFFDITAIRGDEVVARFLEGSTAFMCSGPETSFGWLDFSESEGAFCSALPNGLG